MNRKKKIENRSPEKREPFSTFYLLSPAPSCASRGFTLLYAVLISSILLAIGIAIFEITVRELQLSSITRESGYAFYAADSGIECALYADFKHGGLGSAFAGGSTTPATSGVLCGSQDIAANGTPPSPYQSDTSVWTSWVVTTDGGTNTTVFKYPLSSGARCAIVSVVKTAISDDAVSTIIDSRGYNVSCGSITTEKNAVERALRVSY